VRDEGADAQKPSLRSRHTRNGTRASLAQLRRAPDVADELSADAELHQASRTPHSILHTLLLSTSPPHLLLLSASPPTPSPLHPLLCAPQAAAARELELPVSAKLPMCDVEHYLPT
jgi:hypothetical protein